MDIKITSLLSLSFVSCFLFLLFSSRLSVACMVAGHNTRIAHVDVSRPLTSEKLFESFFFTGFLLSTLCWGALKGGPFCFSH